jgi:hypothetical protein
LVETLVTGRVDLSRRKNKNGYYHSFKTQFGGRLGEGLGHEWDWSLTRINIKIKMVIIIVLKSDWSLTRINIKTKMVIIIVLKSDSMVDPE